MAPPKVYDQRKDLHLNVENEIYEIGNFFGLKPASVLKDGYTYIINQFIEQYGAPTEIKERWSRQLHKNQKELQELIDREKSIEENSRKDGQQKRISYEIRQKEKDDFKEFVISTLIPSFSVTDIQWLISLAKSDNASVTRQVIPFLRNNFQIKTKSDLPQWSMDQELDVINHLIDLGGV